MYHKCHKSSANFWQVFVNLMHKVNSTCAHPTTGKPGAFAQVLCPRGQGFCAPRGRPPRNLIHKVSKPSKARAVKMRALFLRNGGFIGKDMDFTLQYLVRKGLDKLVEIFRGKFSNFRKFSSAL